MSLITGIEVVSHNCDGLREIRFTMRRGLLGWIFKQPAQVITCVSRQDGGTFWHFKDGLHRCGLIWDSRCVDAWARFELMTDIEAQQ